jgi:hypothetical protein
LFSLLDALNGVVFKTEPKKRGLGLVGVRKASSELADSQTFENVNDNIDCAS